MAAHGFVAVVGARVLPESAVPQVADVVGFFLSRGWGIGSGGARGAGDFARPAGVAAGAGGGWVAWGGRGAAALLRRRVGGVLHWFRLGSPLGAGAGVA